MIQAPTPKENFVQAPISIFLTDEKSVDSGIVFLKSVQYIYSFDVKKSAADSSKFHKQFQSVSARIKHNQQ